MVLPEIITDPVKIALSVENDAEGLAGDAKYVAVSAMRCVKV